VEFDPRSDRVHFDSRLRDASGYFVLDTESGDAKLQMSEEEWKKAIKEYGVNEKPLLRSPSRFRWRATS